MPWRVDSNGQRKYEVSIYTKEELPTWDELYNMFWVGERFVYDPEHVAGHQVKDVYWQIHARKVLLATVCNQLNKMLFEDDKRQAALAFISENMLPGASDIRFTCIPEKIDDIAEFVNSICLGTDSPPPIYTFPNPSGKDNPFIVFKGVPRIDITEMTGKLVLCPHILFDGSVNDGLKSDGIYYVPRPDNSEQVDDYKSILKFLLEDVIGYFENGVGWKNPIGELIAKTTDKLICPSGYDPAL